MNPTFDQTPAPKKSRWKIYLLIVVVVLIPVVLILGIVIAVLGAVFLGTKSVDEYKCAMAEVRKNEKAIEVLGEPMEEGIFMFPNIEINGPRRYVNFSTSMSGPKKSGTLYVMSERTAFASNFLMTLDVNGNRIMLHSGTYPCK